MCNFHQVAIIRRYLTKKPKMQASKELWELALLLVKTDKESFEGGLQALFDNWADFLNERKTDIKGKNRYLHKKLRSAYRSLKTNLPWLFTWYDNMGLKIPSSGASMTDRLRGMPTRDQDEPLVYITSGSTNNVSINAGRPPRCRLLSKQHFVLKSTIT